MSDDWGPDDWREYKAQAKATGARLAVRDMTVLRRLAQAGKLQLEELSPHMVRVKTVQSVCNYFPTRGTIVVLPRHRLAHKGLRALLKVLGLGREAIDE